MTSPVSSTGKNPSSAIPYHPSHGFKPQNGQSFPKKEEVKGTRTGNGGIAIPDEPTNTPDFLLKAHEQGEEFERSERIAAGEHIVPTEDKTEWIESDKDNWLAKDASR